jgi:hypothetical protein
MRGDFSRQTFNRKKNYRSVMMQQGRVQLDSDWNEQQAITQYYDESQAQDIIGCNGAPKEIYSGGFKIGVAQSKKDLAIAKGHIYVDGILCENEIDELTLKKQQNLSVSSLPSLPGIYLVYIDVWQRCINALDDPDIREKALGGPDTTTRIKTVWQVKCFKVAERGTKIECKNIGSGWIPPASSGRLTAKTEELQQDTGPCQLPKSSGYHSLENQLYRLEIQKGGSHAQATFKWSRENGSVEASIKTVSSKTITLNNLRRDPALGFTNSQWVEIVTDKTELAAEPDGQPSSLVKITSIHPSKPEVTVDTNQPQVSSDMHPKMRRWDHTKGDANGIPLNSGTWHDIEYGIKVNFSNGTYHSGDYWLIPARTAINSETGIIEWPLDETGTQPASELCHGVKRHYSPLALVDFDGTVFALLQDSDCRQVFPPLTDITAADVKYLNTNCLPELANAKTVQDAVDILCKNSKGCSTFTVTPQKGWEKIFDYIGEGKDAQICFQAGVFKTEEPIIIEKKGNILISGCGAGTQIIASNYEAAFKFKNCKEIHISNISVESGKAGATGKYEHLNGAVSFEDCTSVVIENAILSCPSGPEQSCTCVTVINSDSFPDAATGKGLVSIGRCNVVIGQSQSGILIVNAARALVEDNILRHPETAKKAGFDEFAKNKVFRAKAKKLLISDAYIGSDVSASASRNTSVSYGRFKIFFNSDKSVAKSWQDIIDANPPEKVKNTGELLIHAKKIAEKAILDKKFRETSPLLMSLYNIVSKTELPPAFQGIVVGGKTAKDIRILNNTVIGVLQGIHIGVSHSASATSPPDKAGTVKISGNNIGTHLFSAKNERHGIFVGNCDSLLVESNYINIQRDPKKKIMIDGIRVYGHLGKFMIIRQNHVVDFRTGIFIKPLNVVSTPLWLVQYNMLQNSEKQVDAPNSVKKEQNYA